MKFGEPLHMEVSDANSSPAKLTFLLYKGASTTAYTLKDNEYIVVTDIIFFSTAGGAFTIAFDATLASSTGGVAGTLIAKGSAAAQGGVAHHFETPMEGMKGITPTMFAAAGRVDCVMQGYITEV